MPMISPAHLLLVGVAAIWGFAFVAQTLGMAHLGPHSFNAARFLLGALSLLPLWLLVSRGQAQQWRTLLLGSVSAGTLMFGGFSFQQIGLLHTSAGNAGFITGIYIVLVPLAGMLMGRRGNVQSWIGVALAVAGLYCLSVTPGLGFAYGDALVLVGAFFWAAHVITIGWLSPRTDSISLSIGQFLVAALWAAVAALLTETPRWSGFVGAGPALLYAGVASSGIAFTLQIIAQRRVPPATTALILSTEAVFAALGGALLLDETLGAKELLGCGLMLAGMLVSQWPARRRQALPA